jgi:hypothetical protein
MLRINGKKRVAPIDGIHSDEDQAPETDSR